MTVCKSDVDGFIWMAAVYGILLLARPKVSFLIYFKAGYIGGILDYKVIKPDGRFIRCVPPVYDAVAAINNQQSSAGVLYIAAAQRCPDKLSPASSARRAFAYGLVYTVITTKDVVFKQGIP